MGFPKIRMRRLRNSGSMRRLVRETTLSVDDLVYPLFVKEGERVKEPISSMTDCFHFSPFQRLAACRQTNVQTCTALNDLLLAWTSAATASFVRVWRWTVLSWRQPFGAGASRFLSSQTAR